MFDHIADRALKNVWCTPGQDAQARLKLPRISPRMGVWNRFEVMRGIYTLPEQGVRFHVFQIGQLNPLILGLTSVVRKWVTFAQACTAESLIADLYTAKGYQFPKHQCWYYVTDDKNVFVAIKEQTTIPADMGVEDLYLRVYSNAYFDSDRADSAFDYIEVGGKTVKDVPSILALQDHYNKLKTQPGLVYATVNGFQVSGIDLFTCQPGDVIEYVYDASIYRVLDFALKDLSAYKSSIDNKQKFLVHSPEGSDTIDFEDDIDVLLYKPGLNGRYKGVFVHRNQKDAMRMVTHCDYGIAIPYLQGLASGQVGWEDLQELRIRLHVRKAGWKRPLVDEASRIRELYKMPSGDVLKAMTGVDSTVSPWRAEQLEASSYCAVMAYKGSDLPRELVQNCFGYNALAKYLGDTPSVPRKTSNQQVVDVPLGLQVLSTAYEYDAQGLLIDWHDHIQGSIYAVRSSAAKLVETISGVGGNKLDEVYGQKSSAIDPSVDYRFYLCDVESGNPTGKWRDVTGSGKYTIVKNAVVWNIDLTREYPLVRGNRNFLAYSLALMADRGTLRFSLSSEQLRAGKNEYRVMEVPAGELDVFLNEHSLIEGLDYIVHFPEVVILNKRYLVDPMKRLQRIDIRFTGFCKSDLTRERLVDQGFVRYGLLSNNNRFDVRDDKVQRIIVDGKLYAKSELLFAETHSGIGTPDERNGSPYLIRDIVVPMRGLVVSPTYELRDKALVVDKAVSNYLSVKMPGPVFDQPNAIDEVYPIYSPFFARVLFDVKRGSIDNSVIQQHYSDADVYALCKPYENLLPFDPTQQGQEPDADYVTVHPHHLNNAVEVDMYQYRFLLRVIKLYLRSRVSIAHFVSIAT